WRTGTRPGTSCSSRRRRPRLGATTPQVGQPISCHGVETVMDNRAAMRRTFTVREFARLASAVSPAELDAAAGPGARPAERLAALVPLASREREQVPAELDDIVDPYRRSDEVYEESFTQLLEAVRTIAQMVLGSGRRSASRCGAGSRLPLRGQRPSGTTRPLVGPGSPCASAAEPALRTGLDEPDDRVEGPAEEAEDEQCEQHHRHLVVVLGLLLQEAESSRRTAVLTDDGGRDRLQHPELEAGDPRRDRVGEVDRQRHSSGARA